MINTKKQTKKNNDNLQFQNFDKDIIRSWFDAVLNPIIRGFRAELYYVTRKNWTFKAFNWQCEYLNNVVQYINPQFYDIYHQFLIYNKDIEAVFNKHDGQLKKLNEVCFRLFDFLNNKQFVVNILDKIFNKKEFADLYSDKLSTKKYIIEYLINNINELDSGYILSKAWNNNISYLYEKILNNKDTIPYKQMVDEEGEKFNEILSECIDYLFNNMNTISIKTGVPIVVTSK